MGVCIMCVYVNKKGIGCGVLDERDYSRKEWKRRREES